MESSRSSKVINDHICKVEDEYLDMYDERIEDEFCSLQSFTNSIINAG